MVKNPPDNAGDVGLIPGSGRSPGEGIGYPVQLTWAYLVAQPVKNLPKILFSSNASKTQTSI